jgi:hypothetical protein
MPKRIVTLKALLVLGAAVAGTSCGRDDEAACRKMIDKMNQCLPEIQKVKCAGHTGTCKVYIRADAQSRCVSGMKNLSDDEVDEGMDQIEKMSCSELANAVAPYIQMQSVHAGSPGTAPSAVDPTSAVRARWAGLLGIDP